MTVENTVLRAWSMARERRGIKDVFIFHRLETRSDRSMQYACNLTKNIFPFHKQMTQSMTGLPDSRKGDCSCRLRLGQCEISHAGAESFHSMRFKKFKHEILNRCKFNSSEQLYRHVYNYIENWRLPCGIM